MDVVLFSVYFIFVIQVSYAAGCDGKCSVMVNLDSGPVCGRVLLAENCYEYTSFLGIPYAKAPVGNRRFQPPEPPEPWREPLYATVEGPVCPQKDILYGNLPIHIKGQSEDCLFINVHAPSSVELSSSRNRRRKGLPVLVFVHGGGFYSGSGNTDLHGPEYLMRKNVVVVTFNYRIGVLGFICLFSPKVPCNVGLRDQIDALKWVQRNIGAFGGDPDNVTLMGHGAGSTSVHLLSLSNAVHGLFHRIILLSGTALPSYYTPSEKYIKFVNNVILKEMGINSTDTEEIYAQLVDMPLHKIMYASVKTQFVTGLTTFPPATEREFPGITRIVEAYPLTLIPKGRGNQYPTLMSYTSGEMEFARFVLLMLNTMERMKTRPELVLSPRLVYGLPPDEVAKLAEKVQQRYFNGSATLEKLIKIYSDTYYKYPALLMAQWRGLMGGAPLYLHKLSYESLFNMMKNVIWIDYDKVAHGEDLMYVFRPSSVLKDYVSFPPKTKDDEMKEWMTTMVTNFMRCNNPTCTRDDESQWPPVTAYHTWLQNTAGPWYDVTDLPAEEKELIEFHDSIDPHTRAVSEELTRNQFMYRKK